MKKSFATIQHYKQTPDQEFVLTSNVTNYFGLNDNGDYPFNYYVRSQARGPVLTMNTNFIKI